MSVWVAILCQSGCQYRVSLGDNTASVWVAILCQSGWQYCVSLGANTASVWVAIRGMETQKAAFRDTERCTI